MTSFDMIYSGFRASVIDFDMAKYTEEARDALLKKYLNDAQAEFQRMCRVDLTDRDDMLGCYNVDLGFEEIHILTLGMVWAWHNHKLNQTDNLKNFMSTRDYSLAAAPSNMLREVRTTRDEAWDAFNQAMIKYSYTYGNIEELRP